ncbi:hypothetical protein, partial [Gluconobacter cerinus]|uniref:hypothetical protein n=1 Tax=Gluconobacter cerinus TaxID=38307 RepID=UPI001B8B71B5
SSPVARQAHNLKAVGSNPTPATSDSDTPVSIASGVFLFSAISNGLPFGPVQDRPQFSIQHRVDLAPVRAGSEHDLLDQRSQRFGGFQPFLEAVKSVGQTA